MILLYIKTLSIPHDSVRDMSQMTMGPNATTFPFISPAPLPEGAPTVSRRSANYKPTIWDYNFIQSLNNDFQGNQYEKHAEKLKRDVVHLLKEEADPHNLLKLIDIIQHIGLGSLFRKEIKEVLATLPTIGDIATTSEEDLLLVALQFRLLRQNGCNALQEVFKRFKDERGCFKACLCKDTKGILSLYEASYLSFEGEFLLDEARAFACRHLKEKMDEFDDDLKEQVDHALENPLVWRIPWMEAKWYLGRYKKEKGMNSAVLQLAKLKFNMEQSSHQIDVKDLSRWWRNLGLTETLSFARDRLIECYFFAAGIIWEPKLKGCRKGITKVGKVMTIIDDIYDTYGSLDELQLFTDAIERWEIDAMGQLPDYMRVCYHALLNTTHEIADKISKEQGWDITQYLQKEWLGLCKSFLVEARWFSKGYTPGLEEYLKNAWISVSGPLVLFFVYCLWGEKINKCDVEYIQTHPPLVRLASMIFRLCNDLTNSKGEQERGEGAGSVQCYMHQTGVSEEIARKHITSLIRSTWKKLNQESILAQSHFPPHFIDAAMNLARTAQCVYQYGDGFTVPDRKMKHHVKSLLFEPILL